MGRKFFVLTRVLNISSFLKLIVSQGGLSRFHKDMEIRGGNLSDKYEYVMVGKV